MDNCPYMDIDKLGGTANITMHIALYYYTQNRTLQSTSNCMEQNMRYRAIE